MCLTTKDPAIKIAEQDIIAYKRLEYPKVKFLQRLFKPSLAYPFSCTWKHFIYKKGVHQPKVVLHPIDDGDDEYTVHDGYHTFVSSDHANAMFIIPKGAKYIEGWNNNDETNRNYVSETLVYVGKL